MLMAIVEEGASKVPWRTTHTRSSTLERSDCVLGAQAVEGIVGEIIPIVGVAEEVHGLIESREQAAEQFALRKAKIEKLKANAAKLGTVSSTLMCGLVSALESSGEKPGTAQQSVLDKIKATYKCQGTATPSAEAVSAGKAVIADLGSKKPFQTANSKIIKLT